MAFFTQDFVERVRAANELSQVVGSYNVQLKRAGSNLIGLCPFHNEKSPSFNIRTAEQFFRCFGCGAKGDVFRFVQMMEKVEFPEAVKLLAERAGLPLEFDSPAAARDAARNSNTKTALLWCCSRALDYYEESLRTPGGKAALDYLLSRGFEQETIARWRLGWSPDTWDGLCGFLLKSSKEPGQKEKLMEYARQAGVVRMKQDETGGRTRYYDAFRGRVMFPIMDSQSRPVAFGGRVLVEKPEAGGKYINSPEGRLFEKRKVLFGLPQAAKEISLTGTAVVVEGYTDAIMCHQYGIRNVVATLGTALTEDHVGLLRRHLAGGKGRVVAFFDSDAAGEKATRRAIDLFMQQDVPLAVAGDLALKDAGDFLPRHGADAFREKLGQAEDSFTYLVNRLLGPARSQDLAAVGLAVREVMNTVNLCPDAVKRALMRQRVAAEAGVPEETLPQPAQRAPAAPVRVAARQTARPAKQRGLSPPTAGLEMEDALRRTADGRRRREARLFRYMWESPEWCRRVADSYPPDEWHDAPLAELAALTRDEWDNGRSPAINDIRSRVEDPDAADRLADLAFPDNEPLSEKELARLLDLVRDENRKEEIRLLLGEMTAAQRRGDVELEARLLAEYTKLQAMRKK